MVITRRLAALVAVLASLGAIGEARREVTPTYHLLSLKHLLEFVGDSTPSAPSDACPASVQVTYKSRDDVYLDPVQFGLDSSCNNHDPRRMLHYDGLCEDLAAAPQTCMNSTCDEVQQLVRDKMPFSTDEADPTRLFVFHEDKFAREKELAAFLLEDSPPGSSEPYLQAVQGGNQPRPTNTTGTRTLLSGDVLVVRIARKSTPESECLYISEDRRRDDRFKVSHRVRVEDSERKEVSGTEDKFRELWAAKLGVWEQAVEVGFPEEEQQRKLYLEMSVKKVSSSKAYLLARTVTRSDVIGVALKVRPSFAQTFSFDGHLWYRVDGGRIRSVLFGGWKSSGSFDFSSVLLGACFVLAIATVAVFLMKKRFRRRSRGYTEAPAQESMLSEDEEDREET